MARTEIAAEASLDTTKFQRGLKQADTGVKKFAKNAMSSFGAIAGAAGLGALARHATMLANEITNLSKIAGVTGEELQEISYAAERFGLSQEKVADILKDVNDKVGDFLSTGAGPMADFFENIAPKVGVAADQFRNISSKDALQLYVSSLQKANVSQSEMTFYMEALASDATALIPIFKNNGAELKRLTEEAHKYGQVMDDVTRNKLKAADQTINRFTRSMTVTAGEVLTRIIPAFKILGNGLGFIGDVIGTGIINMNAFFTFLAKSLGDVVEPAIRQFKALGKGIESAMLAAKGQFGEAKKSMKESLEGMKGSFDELLSVPSDIANNFKDATNDIGRNLSSLGDDIEERAKAISQSWGDMTGSMVKDAKEANEEIKQEAPSISGEPSGAKGGTTDVKTGTGTITTSGGSTFQGQTLEQAMADAKKLGIRFQRHAGPGGAEMYQRFENGRKTGGLVTREALEKAAARRPQVKDQTATQSDMAKSLKAIEREMIKTPTG